MIQISIVLLLTALVSIFTSIVWLMVRGSRSTVTYTFVSCQFSLMLWLISQLVIILSESERQLLIGYGVGNLGISFIGSTWLMFAVSYMDKVLSRRFLSVMIGFSALIFAASVTNPIHDLYYTQFGIDAVSHGPLFYISQVYTYAVMLTGIVLVCKTCFENKQHSRGQAVLLTFATGIPMIINLLTLFNVITSKVAFTPISLALSGLFVLFATYRFGFLNVNEVAFEDAFNSIEEGIIVFSRRGRITYLSSAASRMLDISEKTDMDSFIGYLSKITGKAVKSDFDYLETQKDNSHYGIKHYHCRDNKGIAVAQLIIVSDITRYYQLIEKTGELAEARQRLAIEYERNRIAQEVHDTAGHTLTMISSLAKLSKVRLSAFPEGDEKSELCGFMDETEGLARCGITQLRCSVNNLRQDSFMTTVSAAIKTVTDALRDIRTEVCVQGQEDERYSFCISSIYSSFREIITNCVRYSEADRIDVILKFLDTSLELYVFDNGKGCAEIKANNGLRGIIERTEQLGGTAVFRSGADIGFTSIIKIPVKQSISEESGNDKGFNS